MPLHRLPLVGIERAALIQDRFRDANLADIVQHAPKANLFDFRACQAHGFGDQDRVAGHFLGVALRELILRIHG